MSRVAVSGRVALVNNQNLLTFPEAIDNAAWTKTNCTITADSIANPLTGTVDADLLTDSIDGTNVNHRFERSPTMVVGLDYCLSGYFKPSAVNQPTTGNKTFLGLVANNSALEVGFDLVNGLLQRDADLTNIKAASIDSVGSAGWYRAQVGFRCTIGGLRIETMTGLNNHSYTGSGIACFYCWGLQLNKGIVATPLLLGQTATVNPTGNIRSGDWRTRVAVSGRVPV